MSSILMRTEHLTRTFKSGSDTIRALDGVSLDIPAGVLTVLRGRSGSGKTTLLNQLSGLDTPDSGKVYFQEQDLSEIRGRRMDRFRAKSIGFIFQSVALIGSMTALENVEYGLRIAGFYRGESRRRAVENLELLGLGKRMKHVVQQLSGGEQQRVAIARGIAHTPKILFADEPTAELDTATGILIVDTLKRLIAERGMTVVMTTHDPNMLSLADCVYTLSDGRVVDNADD